jgi:hypothetical protein
MTYHYIKPFQPELYSTNSSQHSFLSAGAITSSNQAIESSAVREWIHGPSGRALRFSESSGVDYTIELGTSTAVASTATSMMLLGGTVEIVRIDPGQTHIAIKSMSSATAPNLNITLGRGQ